MAEFLKFLTGVLTQALEYRDLFKRSRLSRPEDLAQAQSLFRGIVQFYEGLSVEAREIFNIHIKLFKRGEDIQRVLLQTKYLTYAIFGAYDPRILEYRAIHLSRILPETPDSVATFDKLVWNALYGAEVELEVLNPATSAPVFQLVYRYFQDFDFLTHGNPLGIFYYLSKAQEPTPWDKTHTEMTLLQRTLTFMEALANVTVIQGPRQRSGRIAWNQHLTYKGRRLDRRLVMLRYPVYEKEPLLELRPETKR